jgi:MFS superfamily sulfate permease-like transporter
MFGVLQGILVAILLAVLLFFHRNWWPHGAVLGRAEGREGWHDLETFPGAQEVPGIVVYRWEAPLFFANAGAFRDQVRKLAMRPGTRWIVLQCEAMTDIDVTAAGMLEALDVELNDRGVHMAFVEMRSRLQDMALRYGLMDTLDADHFYASIEDAFEEITALSGEPPISEGPTEEGSTDGH